MIRLNKQTNRVVISTCNGINLYKPSDIVYFEALGNYSKVFLSYQASPIVIHCSMRMIESELDHDVFFRCHKSFLVNIQHIKEIRSENSKSVLLIDNHEIPLARRRRKNLLGLI